MGDKRVEPVTEMFKAAIARGKVYWDKVDRGEIKPLRDASGNIIPSPSTSKLRSTVHIPAEIS